MTEFWIDPPSGHRFGFPRIYDETKDGNLEQWLRDLGYPVDEQPRHYRMWKVEDGEREIEEAVSYACLP